MYHATGRSTMTIDSLGYVGQAQVQVQGQARRAASLCRTTFGSINILFSMCLKALQHPNMTNPLLVSRSVLFSRRPSYRFVHDMQCDNLHMRRLESQPHLYLWYMYVVNAYDPLMVLICSVPTVQVDIYLIFFGPSPWCLCLPCTSLRDDETGHIVDEMTKYFHWSMYSQDINTWRNEDEEHLFSACLVHDLPLEKSFRPEMGQQVAGRFFYLMEMSWTLGRYSPSSPKAGKKTTVVSGGVTKTLHSLRWWQLWLNSDQATYLFCSWVELHNYRKSILICACVYRSWATGCYWHTFVPYPISLGVELCICCQCRCTPRCNTATEPGFALNPKLQILLEAGAESWTAGWCLEWPWEELVGTEMWDFAWPGIKINISRILIVGSLLEVSTHLMTTGITAIAIDNGYHCHTTLPYTHVRTAICASPSASLMLMTTTHVCMLVHHLSSSLVSFPPLHLSCWRLLQHAHTPTHIWLSSQGCRQFCTRSYCPKVEEAGPGGQLSSPSVPSGQGLVLPVGDSHPCACADVRWVVTRSKVAAGTHCLLDDETWWVFFTIWVCSDAYDTTMTTWTIYY